MSKSPFDLMLPGDQAAVINQIKLALANSLSLDSTLRDEALKFLIDECEPDPNFQLALLHIIKSYSFNQ